MDYQPGDVIEVRSTKVDTPTRRGRIAEVVSRDPSEIRVEWDDGHTSNLYPAAGMVRVVEQSG